MYVTYRGKNKELNPCNLFERDADVNEMTVSSYFLVTSQKRKKKPLPPLLSKGSLHSDFMNLAFVFN